MALVLIVILKWQYRMVKNVREYHPTEPANHEDRIKKYNGRCFFKLQNTQRQVLRVNMVTHGQMQLKILGGLLI